MNSIILNNAALKIQYIFKLNNCIKKLEKFNELNLKNIASTKSFNDFQKIICKKEIITITKNLIDSLHTFKKDFNINPKILITAYIINYYPKELHFEDNELIITSASKVIAALEEKNINNLISAIQDYNYIYNTWSITDKDRSMEQLIISYYNISEHIKKITEDPKIEFSQQLDMLTELEKQRKEITLSIIMIDKTFDINYLKENYVMIYNSIQESWAKIKIAITTTMKKAYFDMLCQDLEKGEFMSSFNLLKDIKSRLIILCPSNRKESFSDKFSDDKLLNLLYNSQFNVPVIQFIIFMVDFIILMDAPINDNTNKQWKDTIIQLMTSNFNNHFPLILILIQEHIDSIYNSISKLI